MTLLRVPACSLVFGQFFSITTFKVNPWWKHCA
jgi:hypothetical protein